MDIKRILKSHLSPKQMKAVKSLYMQVRYLSSRISKKYGMIKENTTIINRLTSFSLPNKHVFFGYYDLQQFDKDHKRLLVHVLDKKKCDPATDDAELFYIDYESGKFVPITRTKAWSWQQGSRLRWHPTKNNTILFNDFEDGHYVSVEWDLTSNQKKVYPLPFYDITPDGKYGLSLNFARLQRLRPGYGYSRIEDDTRDISVPDNEGIVRYNLETDEQVLLVSLKDLAKITAAQDDEEHYINHISVSPSGRRFLFFHLRTSIRSSTWKASLYVTNIETGELKLIEGESVVSHYCWKNDNEIIVTTAAMNAGTADYIEYNVETGEKKFKEGELLHRDGHPSYIHGTDDFISDTYPINCVQHVFMQSGESAKELLRVYADPRLHDDMRCDLHPRISLDNTLITVDSTACDRLRRVIVMELKERQTNRESINNDNFVVVGFGTKNNAIKEMFFEITNGEIDNASYIEPFVFQNKVISKVHRVVFSARFRRFFRWIPRDFWEKYHVLNKVEFSKDKQNYIIMTYGTDIERLHFPNVIKKIKKEMGDAVCFVLMLFDSIDSPLNNHGWKSICDIMKEFDIVASFDKEDCARYGMLHFTDPYAKRDISPDPGMSRNDIFFVGADKGRGNLLFDMEKKLSAEGVSTDFCVAGLPKKLSVGGLRPIKSYMPYSVTLQHISASDCLLEVLCSGQNSASLRYYEAVVYNKKLLTNNPSLKDMQYYDPKFMKSFRTLEDIDVEWIKEKIDVDYHYNGEFSICKFFTDISTAWQEKKRGQT